MREERYQRLKELLEKYRMFKKSNADQEMSEEATRVWINDFLEIFGWDVHNLSQVVQEQTVGKVQRGRLEQIDSSHSKPDYTLVNGKMIKTYLDAKKSTVDIFKSREAAFQIRSYGWSAGVPCAFLSNFEQFSILDCRDVPSREKAADVGAIQIGMDEYLEKFDVLEAHLDRSRVYLGGLEQLYSIQKIEGYKTVDLSFNETLSVFRLELANDIYKNNEELGLSMEQLNYYVQLILNRIVFIRVCESKGIEKQELLRSYVKEGFWERFKESCRMKFYERYDGAMFSIKDEIFWKLRIEDTVFEKFIEQLYYPYPYKFDAIPVYVIAKVYEEFLAYSLTEKKGVIVPELKQEYVKTNGAVPTDAGIAEMISEETFALSDEADLDEILRIKVLDPCCGSGIFLIAAYEQIAKAFKERADKESRYCLTYQGETFLTLEAKRTIMCSCLYGIDIDRTAIEVTKMSLALKLIDDVIPELYLESGMSGEKILRDIHKNIVCGNTLADGDIPVPVSEIAEIKPLSIQRRFPEVFAEGGFSHIVGNPPYVETKFFKSSSQTLHRYLKEKYHSFEGKADLAVLFLERCLSLLKEQGVLGIIIQRRWFKTSYGKNARKVIADSGYLKSLFDIGTTKLFPGRITYVSIMILEKKEHEKVNYDYICGEERSEVVQYWKENRQKEKKIPMSFFQNNLWSPEFYDMIEIKNKYAGRLGTLGENKKIHIRDGIQALWKKVYHITQCEEKDGLICGKNGFGEEVCLEKELVKPVIYNREFLPLKALKPDAYCLFPYRGEKKKEKISIQEIRSGYPYAYAYLQKNKERILAQVTCCDGEFWHTFTREHNHEWFSSKKVIIPMTARDTFATYECGSGCYMDNSNVWFLNMDPEEETELKALTMILNSTVFSVFAKIGANPQSGNYYKFNKQFLTPVPFPNDKMKKEDPDIKKLAGLYEEISAMLEQYNRSGEQERIYYESVLEARWEEVDKICELMYDLESADVDKIRKMGRAVSRVTGTER